MILLDIILNYGLRLNFISVLLVKHVVYFVKKNNSFLEARINELIKFQKVFLNFKNKETNLRIYNFGI